ncbi:Longitudinals lacking protein, isoforms A/B/D/L, partial [Camponotus floridanus]
FTCTRCGRSYMRKDSLQRHIHWECGKEPQFQCPFCPQRCKRKAHWLRHMRRQHK